MENVCMDLSIFTSNKDKQLDELEQQNILQKFQNVKSNLNEMDTVLRFFMFLFSFLLIFILIFCIWYHFSDDI